MKKLIFYANKGLIILFSTFILLIIFFNTQLSAKIYTNFNECIEKNISSLKSEDHAKALIYLCERIFPQKINEINENEIKQNILLISRLIDFMKKEMESFK